MGLYRSDGLDIFRNMIGTETERKKKDLGSTSKNNDLSMMISFDLT